jgi:hypothetical protein
VVVVVVILVVAIFVVVVVVVAAAVKMCRCNIPTHNGVHNAHNYLVHRRDLKEFPFRDTQFSVS